jgi:signal peptidase II
MRLVSSELPMRATKADPRDALRYIPLIVVTLGVFLLDQWSKAAVSAYINGNGGPVSLLGGKVLFNIVHNTGAAFGILPNQTVLFILIALAIVAGLIFSYHRLAQGPLWIRVGLGLVLGGAIGNLTDRVRLGYVVDFIDLRWWPVFNLADSSIVIGVCILIVTLMFEAEHRVAPG